MAKDIDIKFKGANTHNFATFLKKSNIKTPQMVDIGSETITSRAHPEDKSLIKYVSAKTQDVLGDVKAPDGFKKIRFPFYDLKKAKSTLGIFKAANQEEVNGYFHCEEDDSEHGGDGVYVGKYFYLVSENMKIKIKAGESYLISYLDQERWEKISDVSDYVAKLELSSQYIERIKKLCKLDADSNTKAEATKSKNIKFRLILAGDKIYFSSHEDGKWKIRYDGNKEIKEEDEVTINPSFRLIDNMNESLYDLYIKKANDFYIGVAIHDENNIVVGAMKAHV